MGPDRAPALRPGVAAERRILAAARLHDQRRLRRRLPQHAPGQRSSVAHADHAGRHRGIRQEADAGHQQDRVARSRRRDAGGAARGRSLAAGPQGGSQGRIRHHQRAASRRRLCHQQGESLVRGREAGGTAGAFALRLPHAAPHAGGIARRVCPPGLAARGRIPDAQSHAPRPRGTDVPRRQAGGGQSADSSRRSA